VDAQPNTTEAAPETTEQPTPTPADKQAEQPKLFTQAEIDKIIADRLTREEKKRAEATDKARRDAEEKALADNAKWQELAEKRAKEIDGATQALAEMETLRQQHEAATTALGRYLDTERKGLPDHIIGLLDKLGPVEQLEWLASNKDKLVTSKPQTEADKRGPATEPSQDWQKVAAQKFGIRLPQQ
jgi:hypothetical protein